MKAFCVSLLYNKLGKGFLLVQMCTKLCVISSFLFPLQFRINRINLHSTGSITLLCSVNTTLTPSESKLSDEEGFRPDIRPLRH